MNIAPAMIGALQVGSCAGCHSISRMRYNGSWNLILVIYNRGAQTGLHSMRISRRSSLKCAPLDIQSPSTVAPVISTEGEYYPVGLVAMCEHDVLKPCCIIFSCQHGDSECNVVIY